MGAEKIGRVGEDISGRGGHEADRNSIRANGILRAQDYKAAAIADRWLDMFEEIRQRKKTRRNAL